MLDEAKDNNNQKKVDLIKKVIALKESQKQKEVNPFKTPEPSLQFAHGWG
jgi:hypothetical protein